MSEMLKRVGNLFLLLGLIVVAFSAIYIRLYRRHRWKAASQFVRRRVGMDTDLEIVEELEEVKGLPKHVLTKLKIIIAAWQIGSSAVTVFPHIRFPSIFDRAMQSFFQVLGLGIFDVSSLSCVLKWGPFERLLFMTLAPFATVFVVALAFWLRQRSKSSEKKKLFLSRFTYFTTLFVYVVLPGISTSVITYFSCSRFDRGTDRSDYFVMTRFLNIECSSSRYKLWRIYAAIMVVIWPLGVPFVFATFLWSHRSFLNPHVDERDLSSLRSFLRGTADVDNFARQRRKQRHIDSMLQLQKLRLRREHFDAIAGLEFLFEEYNPACYLFPVFEILRRIFLTSVLAVFYPGSTQQNIIGVLGAMFSFIVYDYFEPHVEDDDNAVSAVAQGELVLIYFAALAIFTSQLSDQQRNAYSSVGFGLVLLVIFFACFVLAAYQILVEIFCAQIFSIKRRKHSEERPVIIWGKKNDDGTVEEEEETQKDTRADDDAGKKNILTTKRQEDEEGTAVVVEKDAIIQEEDASRRGQ